MNRTIDAYAAGLLDGEGCIGIAKSRRGTAYSVRVDFGMTQKAAAVLHRMAKEYGGLVRNGRLATEQWDAVLTWKLHGQEATAFLREVIDHLVLKRQQAELAIRVQEIRDGLPQTADGRGWWTPEATEECARIQQQMMKLNRKGPSSPATKSSGGRPAARLVGATWMSLQPDLFSDSGFTPYSATLPAWGMTRSGVLFELPTPALPTSGRESSSLPTPTAGDGTKASTNPETSARRRAKGQQPFLTDIVQTDLLPTPRATRGGSATETVNLLPTPTVMDMGSRYTPDEREAWKAKQREAHRNGNGHGASLTQEALSIVMED